MADRRAALVDRAARALGRTPTTRQWVPGRLELFGKHTDYAGGVSLTAALDRGIAFVGAPAGAARCTVTDAVLGESIALSPTDDASLPPWAEYARAALRHTGPSDIAFASDLPAAAGLASSTALVTGFTLCSRPMPPDDDPLALGEWLGAIERGGVGTEGGCQDSTAMLVARAGTVTALGYRPSSIVARIPWPAHWRVVIAVSGVRAEKAGAAREDYNRASRLAADAATARGASHLGAIDGLDEPDGDDPLARRTRHFVRESTGHVPAAIDAVRRADATALGRVARASTRDAIELLANQTPETIGLVAAATDVGAIAASPFGAGFGGSVWAVVDADASDRFIARWGDASRNAAPAATFFATTLAGPAGPIDPEETR